MSRDGRGDRGSGGGPRSDCPLDCKVYVGELGKSGNREELEKAFGAFGKLRNVWVATNPPGFAFIMFEDARDAKYAVRDLDGRTICGRRVRVEMSSGKTRYDGRGGDRGGRGGGRDDRDGDRDHHRYAPYDRRAGNGGGYGGRNGPSPPPRSRGGSGYDRSGASSGGGGGGSNYERRDYDTARSRTKRYSRSRSRSPVYRRNDGNDGYSGSTGGRSGGGGRPRTPLSRSPSPKANSR